MVRFSSVLLLAVACGGDPADTDIGDPTVDTAPPTTTPTGGTTEPVGPNPWKVEDQQGSVVTVFRHFAPGRAGGFDVHATFAQSLPLVDDAGWCLAGGPCANQRPAPDSYVDMWASPPVDDVAFSWVGNEIEVWRLDMPFINVPDPGYAYYSHTVAKKPGDDLLKLHIPGEGEWGGYNGTDVPVAPTLRVTQPAPGERVNLAGPTLDFEWVQGDGEVFLTIMGERAAGDPINVLYTLADDGEFSLDLDEHLLDPESDVVISLGRRVVDETDVNGNTLFLTGVEEQPYTPECLPWPDTTIDGSAITVSGNQMDPFYLGVRFQGVIAGGELHDFTPEGAEEPRSAKIIFELLDYFFQPQCKVIYDVSGPRAEQVEPWPRYGGVGVIYDAYEFTLRDGWTDCDPVNPLVFGANDMRGWFENPGFIWGVGIGDRVDVPNQATASGYLTFDGAQGIEMNAGFGYELFDCDTAIKRRGSIPPTTSPGDAYWEHDTYFVLVIQ
ncbi:MAG: hypothetical protein ACI8PZ_006114 [Myxococcota bacterium]|jgi:hypothetical protein